MQASEDVRWFLGRSGRIALALFPLVLWADWPGLRDLPAGIAFAAGLSLGLAILCWTAWLLLRAAAEYLIE